MSAAGDDGFELFKKPPPPMRAVVTACGHGGIVSESEHVTRKTTTAATRTLQPEGFGFYVLRVQGDTHSPGLSWSSVGGMPTNFSQYNPEIVLLLNNPENQELLRTDGGLTPLANIIGNKIKEIDIKSGVEYGSRTEKDTHPPEVVSADDFYVTYTPQNPPREDHRLIAAYAGPGEMLRMSDDSRAQLPRRAAALRGMENKRLFNSYGLFFVDSTDEVDKRTWCLTSAGIKTTHTDKHKKTEEHSELEREGLYNLFSSDKIDAVVNLIGWRNGFLLRKETAGVVRYTPVDRKEAAWVRFRDDLDGPVQKFLHAAFYQEISYHDITFIWKVGFLYDEVLFIDVACNCPSTKDEWEYFTQRKLRAVGDMAKRDPRIDGYDKPDPATPSPPPPHATSSPRAKSPPPPHATSSSRAKGGPKKKGGGPRLTNRSKSYQKTSKHLKTTRKRLSRSKKNNTTRRKRYTIRR